MKIILTLWLPWKSLKILPRIHGSENNYFSPGSSFCDDEVWNLKRVDINPRPHTHTQWQSQSWSPSILTPNAMLLLVFRTFNSIV